MPIDDVIAVDWSEPGDCIVSAHLDAVRVWKFNNEDYKFFQGRKGKVKEYARHDIFHYYVKINNFHDFYID